MIRVSARRCVTLGLATSLLLGCGGRTAVTARSHSGGDQLTGTITVFAAASLTETFTALAGSFSSAHSGAHVTLNFGASSALAQSILSGAPADVFAAASTKTMDTVRQAGDTAASPSVFVRNELEIATPRGNPRHVKTLADVAAPAVKLALCAPQVPCGATAQAALTTAGLTAHPVTLEQDVKAVLTKVRLGEVDAGLVYRTDVRAAGPAVVGVPFAEAASAITSYPIATLRRSRSAPLADAFVAYVRSPAGVAVLTRAGFLAP